MLEKFDTSSDVIPPPAILRDDDQAPVVDAPVADTPAPESVENTTDGVVQSPFAEVSSSLGVDFTKLSNSGDAEVVARSLAEQIAEAGLNGPAWWESTGTSVHTPEPPALPSAESAPTFDVSELPPDVAKYVRQLETQQAQVRARLQAEQQALHQQRVESERRQLHEVYRRADAQIDSFSDPKYGVSGTLNFSQRQARQSLVGSVNAIITGLQRTGRPVPQIEQVVKLARVLEGGGVAQPAAPAASVPPQPRAAGTLGAPARRLTSLPPGQRPYYEDPNSINEARAILSRSRS